MCSVVMAAPPDAAKTPPIAATKAASTARPPATASVSSIDPIAALIQTRLKQRLVNLPAIDAITPMAMAGLYEVRIDRQVFYTDASGDFLFQGNIIDTRSMKNLTQERVAQLSAIDFSQLPLKDAIAWKNGTGKHKIAVFADPNCGYCKKLERELQKVPDITVYTFIVPILGSDSTQKSQAIWCSKDAVQTWRDWMLQGKAPAPRPNCDNPIARNQALVQKLRINGTPGMYFEDGSHSPGLMPALAIQKRSRRINDYHE